MREIVFCTLRMYVQIDLKVYEAPLFLSFSKKIRETNFFGPCKAGHSVKLGETVTGGRYSLQSNHLAEKIQEKRPFLGHGRRPVIL